MPDRPKVPEWVYRSELRAPGTDDEDITDPEQHPNLTLLALVALCVAVTLVFLVGRA